MLNIMYFRTNNTSIFDELTMQDADLIGDVDYGADITGRIGNECANRNKSRLLFSFAECLRSPYGKQCGPRSDCS